MPHPMPRRSTTAWRLGSSGCLSGGLHCAKPVQPDGWSVTGDFPKSLSTCERCSWSPYESRPPLPRTVLRQRLESKRCELVMKIAANSLPHRAEVAVWTIDAAMTPDHIEHRLLRVPNRKRRYRPRIANHGECQGCLGAVSNQLLHRSTPANEPRDFRELHPSKRVGSNRGRRVHDLDLFRKVGKLRNRPPATQECHAEVPPCGKGMAQR